MAAFWDQFPNRPFSATLSPWRRRILWSLEAMPCGHHQHLKTDFQTDVFHLFRGMDAGPAAASHPCPPLGHREQEHPH